MNDRSLMVGVVGTAWPRRREVVEKTASLCNALKAERKATVVFLDWWSIDSAAPQQQRTTLRERANGWNPWQTPPAQPPWWDIIDRVADVAIRPLHHRSLWGREPRAQRALNWWGKQQLVEHAVEAKAERLLILSPGEWSQPRVVASLEKALERDGDAVIAWPAWIEGADEVGEPFGGGRGMPRPERLDLPVLAGSGPPVGDFQVIAIDRFSHHDPGRMDVQAGDARATLVRLLAAGHAIGVPVRGVFMADLPIDFKVVGRQRRPGMDEHQAQSIRANMQRAASGRRSR